MDNLIEQTDRQILSNKIKSLELSWNELYDRYKHQELRISPAYQKLFRWGEEKQSRFIESLLLEMPVLPVYVMEVNPGEYELIDGLQRVCSYLRFRGEQLDCGHPMPTNRDAPEKQLGSLVLQSSFIPHRIC